MYHISSHDWSSVVSGLIIHYNNIIHKTPKALPLFVKKIPAIELSHAIMSFILDLVRVNVAVQWACRAEEEGN